MTWKFPSDDEVRIDRFIITIFDSDFAKRVFTSWSGIKRAFIYFGREDLPKYWFALTKSVSADEMSGSIKFWKDFFKANPFDFVRVIDYILRQASSTTPIEIAFDFLRPHFLSLGFDFHEGHLIPKSDDHELEREILTELDTLLARVDPSFPAIRIGAWKAFLSNNPDRITQSTTSMREMLSQCLRKLAPNNVFSEAEKKSANGKITRRMRLKKILPNGSKIKIVDSLVGLIMAIYDVQSSGVHAEIADSEALFMIKETEHALHYLLKMIELQEKGRS